MVEVTQDDIAMWADLLAATDNEGTVARTDAVAQGMIAAHRLAAIAEGRRQMREEAAQAANGRYGELLGDGCEQQAEEVWSVVEAIRAIPQGDVGMTVGDTITIAGSYKTAPNPSRQWWQFWKPRVIETKELIHYKITGGMPLPAPPEALPPLPGDGI